jgi:hypothetical protein
MNKRGLTFHMPRELVRDGRFVWRHGPKGAWFREGEDIVFPLHDGHPEWVRCGVAWLESLRDRFPGRSITICTPGGRAVCGVVTDEGAP